MRVEGCAVPCLGRERPGCAVPCLGRERPGCAVPCLGRERPGCAVPCLGRERPGCALAAKRTLLRTEMINIRSEQYPTRYLISNLILIFLILFIFGLVVIRISICL